jgi:hypothetical protein
MPRRVGPEPAVYQLHISLDGIKPLIWRRVLVPAEITLDWLDAIVQRVLSWDNEHMHEFKRGKQRWAPPDPNPMMPIPLVIGPDLSSDEIEVEPLDAETFAALRSIEPTTPSQDVILPAGLPDLSSPETRAEIVAAIGEENAAEMIEVLQANPQLLQMAIEALSQNLSPLDMLMLAVDEGPTANDEAEAVLRNVLPRVRMKLQYLYDFGDSWQHTILLEQRLQPEQGQRYPVCVDGARAAPPEDSGGIWRYPEFCEAMTNPKHPEHADMREWYGKKFDPEAFSADAVNRRLAQLRKWHTSKDGPLSYRGQKVWGV